ncbi:MAG: hypothetical protein M0Q54_00205 [Pigmentiphaga sp.]|nr:hypothetical protein [Pigmentiphaga sp.]
MTERYLEPHQARKREPTVYESLLGDEIERAFSSGIEELPALVQALNNSGLTTPGGESWTEENYCDVMARLAYPKD